MELPEDYLAYMHSGKPLLGFSDWRGSRESFVLWELDHLNQVNKNLAIQEFLPDFLTFAGNHTGELYAFDCAGAVYCFPVSDKAPAKVMKIAGSWADFEKHFIFEDQ